MTGRHQSRDRFLSLDDRGLLGDCAVDTYRASGPGGQKRNKTDSAVRLRHLPTRLIVTAVESRSQHENRARALRRLRMAIALNLREPVEIEGYRPGPVLLECLTQAAGLHVGRRDHRYTPVVAEVLDLLAARDVGIAATAAMLGISTGKLISFFKRDPGLWARVAWMRADRGMRPLK